MFIPKTDSFRSKWAKMGLILDLNSENPVVLKFIPGVELQNTSTL